MRIPHQKQKNLKENLKNNYKQEKPKKEMGRMREMGTIMRHQVMEMSHIAFSRS